MMVFGAGLCLRTAIPVVCMGVLSPLGHALDRRLGLKRSMLVALAILTVGLVLRLRADAYAVLLVTAALVGIGDAIIRPILSGFIKDTFPDKTFAAPDKEFLSDWRR
ncbi:hypothetical protein [Pandoraea sp. NPDC090278]|uniref:hypothetical protein n=1 Tax=Pandoraea sp. NPDC090278 TaxID=3364391 RepID=UPI00383B6942